MWRWHILRLDAQQAPSCWAAAPLPKNNCRVTARSGVFSKPGWEKCSYCWAKQLLCERGGFLHHFQLWWVFPFPPPLSPCMRLCPDVLCDMVPRDPRAGWVWAGMVVLGLSESPGDTRALGARWHHRASLGNIPLALDHAPRWERAPSLPRPDPSSELRTSSQKHRNMASWPLQAPPVRLGRETWHSSQWAGWFQGGAESSSLWGPFCWERELTAPAPLFIQHRRAGYKRLPVKISFGTSIPERAFAKEKYCRRALGKQCYSSGGKITKPGWATCTDIFGTALPPTGSGTPAKGWCFSLVLAHASQLASPRVGAGLRVPTPHRGTHQAKGGGGAFVGCRWLGQGVVSILGCWRCSRCSAVPGQSPAPECWRGAAELGSGNGWNWH